ncbi:hypothetical protein C8J56DRAFT_925341 [Mycena floridula]|nr:hypothetical protein C8J56DRAFT_925341 [Mycena floridula]
MQCQLWFKILRRLYDQIGQPSIRYLLNLWSFLLRKLKFFRSKLFYSKPADSTVVTICSSRSVSSEELGSIRTDAAAMDSRLSSPNVLQVDAPQETSDAVGNAPGVEQIEMERTGYIEPSMTPTLSQVHPEFLPISAEEFARYSRNIFVPDIETDYIITALSTNLTRDGKPAEWTAILHPEGAGYFVQEEKRIFTDANIFDPRIYARLTGYILKFEDYIRVYNIQLDDVDVVFDLLEVADEGEHHCRYYMVAHRSRSIFWLDARELPVWYEVKGVTCPDHIRHELEAQYWFHSNTFPSAQSISASLIDELRDVLIHAVGDTLTSTGGSTVPYEPDELQNFLELTSSMSQSASPGLLGSMCIISRLMFIFVRQRFYDFHGQPAVRLNRSQSVYGIKRWKMSPLASLMSAFCFSAPDVHFRELQKIWVDRLVHSGAS